MKMLQGFALLALLLLTGCGSSVQNNSVWNTKASYFDGQASVQYAQTRHSNDYVSVALYEAGTYHVEFSTPPGSSESGGQLPQNFDATIISPREFVINQNRIPSYLRVTITKNGVSEFHDFQ